MIKKLKKIFQYNEKKQIEKINELVENVNNGGGGDEQIIKIVLNADMIDGDIRNGFVNEKGINSIFNQLNIKETNISLASEAFYKKIKNSVALCINTVTPVLPDCRITIMYNSFIFVEEEIEGKKTSIVELTGMMSGLTIMSQINYIHGVGLELIFRNG